MNNKLPQSTITYLAATLGAALTLIVSRPFSINAVLIGSMLSVLLGLGMFALVLGELSLQGRRGPVIHYAGMTARLLGVLMIIIGIAGCVIFLFKK